MCFFRKGDSAYRRTADGARLKESKKTSSVAYTLKVLKIKYDPHTPGHLELPAVLTMRAHCRLATFYSLSTFTFYHIR